MTTPARPQIDHLPPYSFPDMDLPGVDRVVQLAQNELAIPPSPRAIEAVRRSADDMHRYSDTEQTDLRLALGEVYGLNPANLMCGAGSLELMNLLATAYCDNDSEVVVSQYGYKFFQVLCTVAGATVRVVAEPRMRIDIEALLAAVNARTRVVFLVNPGNPTGLCLPPDAVRELHARLPPEVMLVLDGAYAEFVDDTGFESGFDLVDAGGNVVVLRTFSKAYGLAGMRVGWCYAPRYVIETLARIRVPNSISTSSLMAAEAAVLDRDYLAFVRGEISELRGQFIELAQSLGLVTLPSTTNFVLFECTDQVALSAAELDTKLRANGVILRPMGSYELHDHLRVSIGSRPEMEIFSKVLTGLLT
jgi:histidinol-phosphate aminotransferase